jgi:hypothetical protein
MKENVVVTQDALSRFTGTTTYTSLGFPRNVALTDGTLYVAEHGGESGAFWLMQTIASHIPGVYKRGGSQARFHVWTLTVAPDKSAVLEARLDKGTPVLAKQDFTSVDFEEGEWMFFVGQQEFPQGMLWVIFLPFEY